MNEPKPYVSAYYYSFDLTGIEAIDEVLSLVAAAGKGYHSTEFWNEEAYGGGPSYIERIQKAADDAAAEWRARENHT